MGVKLTDSEKWYIGVARVRQTFEALSPLSRDRLRMQAAAIKSRKETLQLIAEGADAGHICRACRGECCKGGKSHVTAVDLLVYFSEEKEIFTPCFDEGTCSCLGEEGCLMAPAYRPFNCITFICERVDELLRDGERRRFYGVERELRALYDDVEKLLGRRIRYSPLRLGEMT